MTQTPLYAKHLGRTMFRAPLILEPLESGYVIIVANVFYHSSGHISHPATPPEFPRLPHNIRDATYPEYLEDLKGR